jgi:hypothetical protein
MPAKKTYMKRDKSIYLSTPKLINLYFTFAIKIRYYLGNNNFFSRISINNKTKSSGNKIKYLYLNQNILFFDN